jgi:cellobiose phosphorylase
VHSADHRHLIIAYFSREAAGGALTAREALRGIHGRGPIRLYESAGLNPTGIYADLKLPDETLLIATVPRLGLASATRALQSGGARSIFLFATETPFPEDRSPSPTTGIPCAAKVLRRTVDGFRQELKTSRDYLVESVRLGHAASPAAQWVMDNVYSIDLALTDLEIGLKPACRLLSEPAAASLRSLSNRLLNETSFAITENALVQFLKGAQQEKPLDNFELWSFPLVLRFTLVENLIALATRSRRAQQLRESAFLWADRLNHGARLGVLDMVLSRLSAQPFLKEDCFCAALAEQLQDQETTLHGWMDRLHAPLAEIVRMEHAREARESLLAANAFNSLRTLAGIDFRRVFDAVSYLESALREDPSGSYVSSDFKTRDHARRTVGRIASRSGKSELEVAYLAVRLAQLGSGRAGHLLYHTFPDGVENLERVAGARPSVGQRIKRAVRRHASVLYLTGVVLLTATFLGATLSFSWEAGIRNVWLLVCLGILAAPPLSELATQVLQSLIIFTFPPEPVPRMNYTGGIPDADFTLVAVPMMLVHEADISQEVDKLEVRYLSNPETNLSFALLADFADHSEAVHPSDTVLLEVARHGIASLNARYGNRFLLIHRPRSWSPSEQKWIGPERKRGKVEELNAWISGAPSTVVVFGELPHRPRYVITVDSDTALPPGSALRLIETIAHPLNRVEIDPATGIRSSGYSVVQPRVAIALPRANSTRFTRIFSDAWGSDPYCTAVSDAQQDLFREGVFHGKAIYDVAAFHSILSGRFPSETILSHDLIEGAHAGVCYASDIEVLESLPLTYASFAKRQHRWTRGDWQILDWMGFTVFTDGGSRTKNPLSALNRWRILDNLRRSLVSVCALLLLIFGWFFSETRGLWSLVIAVAAGIPALVPLLDRFSRALEGTTHGWRGAADDLQRACVMLVFLPHQAWLTADAVLRALYRRYVSRRHLLEWQSAESVDRHFSFTGEVSRQLWWISLLSLCAMAALQWMGGLLPASPFLVAWVLSPAIAYGLARPASTRLGSRLDTTDRRYLRQLARLTWRYFDDLVGPNTNWLPPDNSQLSLNVEVAQRTSPTNIGLWLNAALTACELGYLTIAELQSRTSQTLATMEKLERYEGHLLNWVDTATLQTLRPAYVSTVDSGNLIAALWVLDRGCRDLEDSPALPPACREGMLDSVRILSEQAGEDPSLRLPLEGLQAALDESRTGIAAIGQIRLAGYHASVLRESARWSVTAENEPGYWIRKLIDETDQWIAQIDRYLRWMETLSRPSSDVVSGMGSQAAAKRAALLSRIPTFRELAEGPPAELRFLLNARSRGLRPELTQWLSAVEREYDNARREAAALCARMDTLAAQTATFAASINMRLLYDSGRRVFGIGYAVGEPLAFSSHYDLLASECRLASLVAIAKGDVPIAHWFALSRPRVSSPSRQALLSWSGTLFEYLMPLIYTEAFEHSLLAKACEEAVDAQIQYGRSINLPWGVSESAYGALDARQTYQYKAFGIPQLALNPSADPGPVVAPYATALALMVRSQEAIANLLRLQPELMGSMGFYEAIDYTRSSRRDEEPGVEIFAYMAHHQAMSLLAIHVSLDVGVTPRARFHSIPRIRAVESLLFERVPIARVESDDIVRPAAGAEPVFTHDRIWSEPTPVPHVFLSASGNYALMVSNNGGGYGRWNGFEVTRWRADSALDDWGTYVWVRDVRSNAMWVASHPHYGKPEESLVIFGSDRAEFIHREDDLETKLEVTTTTENEGEFRRLTITNRGLRARQVEVTAYVELALAPAGADSAHPAFSRMFVETEAVGPGALLATRRRRAPDEAPIWVAALMSGAGASMIGYETDRRAFVGRNRSVTNAAALTGSLSGTTGAVMDPVFAFRCTVRVEARRQHQLSLTLLAASSREELIAALPHHQSTDLGSHVMEMVWARAQLEFRHLRIGSTVAHRFQELAMHLIYPNPARRPVPRGPEAGPYGQRELWRFGISGDLPILTVSVADGAGMQLVREVLLAKAYWRLRGFEVDVIILNREVHDYFAPLAHGLARLLDAHVTDDSPRRPGRAHVIQWTSLDKSDQALLLASSRAALGAHRGSLQRQLLTGSEIPFGVPFNARRLPVIPADASPLPALDLIERNANGGFTPSGEEYVIDLAPGMSTPLPWSNVISNPGFGTVLTESGLGFTWAHNSQQNRLTPWHNDPVRDRQSEVLYVRDEEDGSYWSPLPSLLRDRTAHRTHRIRHGQGYTRFESRYAEVHHLTTVFVARDQPLKFVSVDVTNEGETPRQLTVTYFVEWVLGSSRETQQGHVYTAYKAEHGILSARQAWTGAYRDQVAFVTATPRAESCTGDRLRFLGRAGSLDQPAALRQKTLDNRTGFALDPCGALQVRIFLPPRATRRVTFLLGATPSLEEATHLAAHYSRDGAIDAEFAAVRERWNELLSTVRIKTPDPALNLMMNRWLLYQSLSCRMWGRSAFYQSGGAFGFRDQLQDCLALTHITPQLSREHILNAAAHQFPQGDVQHWWHPRSNLGVRTRCSDDLLWLPWVVACYVEITNDRSILNEKVAFADGPVLEPHEHERLFEATDSPEAAPLVEHCLRAIEHGSKLGPHGLPLIGNGDWNDGLNRVGVEGRGESVWLAWFLTDVLQRWVRLNAVSAAKTREWSERAASIREAIEANAWDGEWYRRGFFDDGTPLGSSGSSEAQIDSVAQSWAAITGAARRERTQTALASAVRLLVRPDQQLALLFTPPFDHSRPHPGYIMAYPPGVRENGGQYTHAAIWLAKAFATIGDGSTAAAILRCCNPAHRDVEKYRGEPYAVAADIYASDLQMGAVGWTWYTGSAAWLYRVWLEDILGVRRRGDALEISPVLPQEWNQVQLSYRFKSAVYEITMKRDVAAGEQRIEADGVKLKGSVIQLEDDGATHSVLVALSAVSPLVAVGAHKAPPDSTR